MAEINRITVEMDVIAKVNKAEEGINKLKSSLSKLKIPEGLDNSFKKSFSNLGDIFSRYKAQLEKGFNTKTDISNFQKVGKELDAELDRLSKHFTALSGKEIDFKVKTDKLIEAEKELEKVTQLKEELIKNTLKLSIEGKQGQFKELEATLDKIKTIAGDTKAGRAAGDALDFLKEGKITQALNKLQEVQRTINNIRSSSKKDTFADEFGSVSNVLQRIINEITGVKGEFDNASTSINNVTDSINNIRADQVKEAANQVSNLTEEYEHQSGAIRETNNATQQYVSSTAKLNEELRGLKTSTQYFFSLRNMINLLKQGLREAFETVKELDAVMTQTAVVTKFDVGDMWGKLPEYTKHANELGATVKDMYESTTLYYQQGLNTQQAMGVATETMKMARIGGLEAADATDKMTAALRGFNMEINATSAQRVNDVYSNLAAKTASNTEEIGTAMQRTASIAASAGMSFEGTAAFLAQAIETTREPAENLGTAMKTIVARFTELKKNPLEIAEVDGEEVDYNKIDAALKTIGVDLKDANGQFRDLDKVFLDISQRWSSLTQTQQRYIATTAAGSRQQSRFIAMMSNYERTVELMDYANNSSGASAEQFNKTLDSLEAKLNQFKNAWNGFLMNIMNDSWVKGIVDIGTKIFDTINKVINALSGGSKTIKSGLSLFTAFMGLRAGGKFINNAIGGLGNMLDPQSKGGFLKGFFGGGGAAGVQTARTQQTIVNPILSKIGEVVAAINNQGQRDQQNQQKNLYSQAREGFNNLLSKGSFKVSDVKKQIKGLTSAEQYALIKSSPTMAKSLKTSFTDTIKNAGLGSEAQAAGLEMADALHKGMLKGRIDLGEYLSLRGTPEKWGEIFGSKYSDGIYKEISSKFSSVPQQQQKEILDRAKMYQKAYGLSDKATEDIIKNQTEYAKKQVGDRQDQTVTTQQLPAMAKKFEEVGGKATAAGMAIQGFGNILNNLGLGAFGGILTTIGSGITSLGMAISGLGPIIDTITAKWAAASAASGNSIINFIKGIGPLGMAGAAAGIALAAVAVWKFVKAKQEKAAREAGEAARKAYEKGYVERGDKITSLKANQGEFERLSKGVDKYNNNLGLSNEEYERYLELNQQIAETSPSLISGYDAEGRAILAKGAALDELIKKEEEERKVALKQYTNAGTLDKVLGEIRVSDIYKDQKKAYQKRVANYSTGYPNAPSLNQKYLLKETEKINSALGKGSGIQLTDQFKAAYSQLAGVELGNLQDLSSKELAFLSQHGNDIVGIIRENNDKITDEELKNLESSLATLSSGYAELMDEAQPAVESLKLWMGQEKIDAVGLELGEEFTTGFTEGTEALIAEGIFGEKNAEEMHTALKKYAEQWKELSGSTSEYSNILKDAKEVQQEYLDNIGTSDAIENYRNNIEESVDSLRKLGEEFKDAGVAGEQFNLICQKTAAELLSFPKAGDIDIANAFDTISDEYSNAISNLSGFDDKVKTDIYTGVQEAKSIMDKVMKYDDNGVAQSIDQEGRGSDTFWKASETLFGRKFTDAAKNAQTIRDQFSKWAPALEEGENGARAFEEILQRMAADNEDLLKGFYEYSEEDGWHFVADGAENWAEIAEKIGLSEEALVSFMKRQSQYRGIDFSDMSKARLGFEQQGIGMVGHSTNAEGKTALYINEDVFREQSGLHGQDYIDAKETAEKDQNVKVVNIDDFTDSTKKEDWEISRGASKTNKLFNDVGIKQKDAYASLDDAVKVLTKTGFDSQQVKDILMQDGVKVAGLGELGQAEREEEIQKSINANAYEVENPVVTGIAGDTARIANAADAMLLQMGIIPDSFKQGVEASLVKADETKNKITDKITDENGNINLNKFKSSKQIQEAQNEITGTIQDLENQKALAESSLANATGANKTYLETTIEDLDEEIKSLNTLSANLQTATEDLNFKVPENISNKENQEFIKNNAFDFDLAFNDEKILRGFNSLKKLEEQGDLTAESIKELDKEFALTNLDRLAELQLSDPKQFAQIMNGLDSLGEEYESVYQLIEAHKLKIELEKKGKADFEEFFEEIGDLTDDEKEIVLQAILKFNNGDEEGGKNLLNENFSATEQYRIEKAIGVLLEPEVEDPSKVEAKVHEQAEKIVKGGTKKVVKGVIKAAFLTKNIGKEPSIKKAEAKDRTINTTYKTDYETNVEETKQRVQNYANLLKQTNGYQVNNPFNTPGLASAMTRVTSYINKLTDIAGKTITTTVLTIKKTKTESGSSGMNNSIDKAEKKDTGLWTGRKNKNLPVSRSLSFPSAASGFNKKKKSGYMTALTGEKGYEVAWIPSENRATILGEYGPEIASFPRDTVVYNHEQSKKIIKGNRNKKDLNSFDGGTDNKAYAKSGGDWYGSGPAPNIYSSGTINVGVVRKGSGTLSRHTEQKIEKSAEKAVQKIIKVSAWWENQARKVEATRRKYDEASEKLTKTFKNFGATSGEINKAIKNYERTINQTIEINKKSEARANAELKRLDTSKKNKTTISYEKTTTNSKGKKEKKSVNENISLEKYIKQDEKTKAYIVDQRKLNEIKNKSKRKAILDEANSQINDLVSKRNTAQDNIKSARDELTDLSAQVYETFKAWEKEITELYEISRRIELIQAKASMYSAEYDKLIERINAGYGTQAGLQKKITQSLKQQGVALVNELKTQQKATDAAKAEFSASLNLQTYAQGRGTEEGDNTYNAAVQAFAFLRNVGLEGEKFNYNKAVTSLYNTDMSSEEQAKIKEILDKIHEKEKAVYDSVANTENAEKAIWAQMNSLQDAIVEFENGLLKGYEDQINDEIDKLDEIDKTLSDALKDLLDEVKNKLEERRKKEDNQKTESDISKKQQRLAMLQADTAGGHAVEIANLQKEIADAQQNYQRSLEDQLLDKLQKQGDKAAKQRELQIELMKRQAEINSKTGSNLEQIKIWLKNPEKYRKQIRNAYRANRGYDEALPSEREKIDDAFEAEFASYLGNKKALKFYDKVAPEIKEIGKETDKNVKTISGDLKDIYKKLLDLNSLRAKGLSAAAAREHYGVSWQRLKKEGYTLKQSKEAGLTLKKALTLGYNSKDVRKNYSAKEYMALYKNKKQGAQAALDYGYSKEDLRKAGVILKDMKNWGWITSAGQALKLGYSTKDVQKEFGLNDQDMIKIIESGIDKNNNITRSDLEGLTDKHGYTYGAGGNTKSKTKGTSVTTIDTKPTDNKMGLGLKTSIKKATVKDFKSNPTVYTQALIEAIKTTKPGKKISDNMKSFVKMADLAGKKYTLSTGEKGTVGTNGKIYYNKGSKIKIWDAVAGKIIDEAYDKKSFLKKAKSTSVGKVYAKALLAKGEVTKEDLKKKGIKFASGGLADFTGPAWLDGTTSKPELVLNAQDTKNFIMLKDVLSSFMGNISTLAGSYADGAGSTFEININVDKIASDYDVDRVAERVKKIIVKDASYRNVTQVRNFR